MLAAWAAIISALALWAEEPAGFVDLWQEYGARLEAEGVTRSMAHAAYVWSEGQYHLGLCRAYLKSGDVSFWRAWWDHTNLADGPMGRQILRAGSEAFTEGLEQAFTDPLSAEQCQRVVDSWFADMRAANVAAPR